MTKEPIESQENADTQEHIQDLQQRAKELAGGELSFFESEEMPPKLREQFWERVVNYEEGEWTTPFVLLTRGGMELNPPDELDDEQLKPKLWEVIRGLAMLRMFLYSTDHLSDRELYQVLWHEVLLDECPSIPIDEDSAWHIDLVGSGSEEDIELYLRYYADDQTRQDWAKDFPDDVMPVHDTPPYDRDRDLPARDQAEWRHPSLAT